MTVYSIKEAAEEVKKNLDFIKSYGGSHYFNLDLNNETIKIRVSDHSANRANNSGRTISFITGWVDQGYMAMVDEYNVNEDGTMNENWRDVEECLDYLLN